MRSKTYFFPNVDKKQEPERITYGFKSRHHPPRHTELEEFVKVSLNPLQSKQLMRRLFLKKHILYVEILSRKSYIYLKVVLT